MDATLERTLAKLGAAIPQLQAVVLSAAPDGLIAWCWTRDRQADIALGFAALDRAAAQCLEGLGSDLDSRSLMLTTDAHSVCAAPLREVGEVGRELSPKLVLTSVFAGEIQRGMVMLHGTRIRMRVREALDGVWAGGPWRRELAEFLLGREAPELALARLSETSGVELQRLSHASELDARERESVRAAIDRLQTAPLLN